MHHNLENNHINSYAPTNQQNLSNIQYSNAIRNPQQHSYQQPYGQQQPNAYQQQHGYQQLHGYRQVNGYQQFTRKTKTN